MRETLIACAAWVAMVAALTAVAAARPPPGTDYHSPIHLWFEAQHSVGGAWCCDQADGHLLDASEWRTHGAFYQVRIDGLWRDVPLSSLRDPRGGPNPTGQAIVWYTVWQGVLRIYCFCPGFEG